MIHLEKPLKTFKLPGILELQPRGVSYRANRWEENEDHDEVRNEEGEGENRIEDTFRFPILDTMQDVTMKKSLLPPYLLSMEKGMRTWTHLCSSSILFVGGTIIYKTLTN